MKKSFTKRILVLLVMMVMASGAIFAVNTYDGNVIITGTIEESSSIALADATKGFTINPTTGLALVDGSVTTITVLTNVYGGYDVTANSTNNGLLGGLTGLATSTIDYSIYIGGALKGLASSVAFDGALDFGTPIITETAATDVDGNDYALAISVGTPSGAFWQAGIFTDTLTFYLSTN